MTGQELAVQLEPEILARLTQRVAGLTPLAQLWGEQWSPSEQDTRVLAELVERLEEMYPYGDERYIGQILKPPHPIAWVSYALTALINPNNHALDGGPATAEMEKEVVAELAEMFGFSSPLGHLTSSGTIANLEALFVARELRPDGVVLSSGAAHYTHERMCQLIGVAHESIGEDALGRMDLSQLEARLAAGGVGTVVATLGTTSLGAVDQLHRIVPLARRYGVRVHVDAAYGGFHRLLAGANALVDSAPFLALSQADSIVVDPHKHGLQPYGCGSVLFADPGVGRFFAHDSPYTYFTSDELHLGEISLECSRAGASAAAFWATVRSVGLSRSGLGVGLAEGRRAALELAAQISELPGLELVLEPELDIVCYYPRGHRASAITEATERLFTQLADRGWHVAKLSLDASWLLGDSEVVLDAERVVVLRSCVMKPEHVAAVPQLIDVLSELTGGAAIAGKSQIGS